MRDAASDYLAMPEEATDTLTPSSHPEHVAVLRALRKDLEQRGFFAPSWRWTLSLMFWVPTFIASFIALLALPLGWHTVPLVLYASMGMLYFGFVGHDCGHYSLSKKPWVNDVWGQLAMSVVCGMSFGWWRHRHNQHHVHCQNKQDDPDMQFGVLFSVYPESTSWKSNAGRFFLRIQRYSFWPLTLFYWVALRYDAVRDLFQQPKVTRPDRLFLPMHFILFIGLPIYFFGWQSAAFAYVACSMLSSLATASVFIPNHIGMKHLQPGQHMSYLEQQVTTSRNVTNPGWFDFYFGGLNYQIEHHLFPRCDHHRLREMVPIVKEVCAKNNLAYHEQPFFEALSEVVRHLGRMTDEYMTSRALTGCAGKAEPESVSETTAA